MSAARTERLLNLLTLLLNSRRPISFREIRELEEFCAYRVGQNDSGKATDGKSSERAFERDKAALVELGVPLTWVAGDGYDGVDEGGYMIDKERYFLPPLALTRQEMALLSMAAAAAATLRGFPAKAAVLRALGKLGFDVGEKEPAPTLAHTPLLAGVDHDLVWAHLDVLHDAIAHRRQVVLTYENALQQVSERRIDPYGLYFRDGTWYLLAYCHLRAAQRTFHLGRMHTAVAEGRRGAFDVPNDIDLKTHVDRRPWELPGSGPEVAVTLYLAPRLRSQVVALFGQRAVVKYGNAGGDGGDGHDSGCWVHLKVRDTDALVAAVLPYGADAQVVVPLSLRQHIGEVYRLLAQRYADTMAAGDEGSLHEHQ